MEGHVTEQETKLLADAMQLETKVTGKANATLVPKVYQSAKTAAAAHHAGDRRQNPAQLPVQASAWARISSRWPKAIRRLQKPLAM